MTTKKTNRYTSIYSPDIMKSMESIENHHSDAEDSDAESDVSSLYSTTSTSAPQSPQSEDDRASYCYGDKRRSMLAAKIIRTTDQTICKSSALQNLPLNATKTTKTISPLSLFESSAKEQQRREEIVQNNIEVLSFVTHTLVNHRIKLFFKNHGELKL